MSYAQYKRVFGKIFIYVGFLALFIGSLLLILKLIVDPERWRGDIETLLKNHINARITLGKLELSVSHGLGLNVHGILIEKEGARLLEIPKLSFTLSPFSVFRLKPSWKIVISKPHLIFEKQYLLQELVEVNRKSESSGGTLTYLLARSVFDVTLEEGDIRFQHTLFKKPLELKNVGLALSGVSPNLSPIHYNLDTVVNSLEIQDFQAQGRFKSEGTLALLEKDNLKLKLFSRHDLGLLKIKYGEHFIKPERVLSSLTTDVIYVHENKTYSGKFFAELANLKIEGDMSQSELNLKTKQFNIQGYHPYFPVLEKQAITGLASLQLKFFGEQWKKKEVNVEGEKLLLKFPIASEKVSIKNAISFDGRSSFLFYEGVLQKWNAQGGFDLTQSDVTLLGDDKKVYFTKEPRNPLVIKTDLVYEVGELVDFQNLNIDLDQFNFALLEKGFFKTSAENHFKIQTSHLNIEILKKYFPILEVRGLHKGQLDPTLVSIHNGDVSATVNIKDMQGELQKLMKLPQALAINGKMAGQGELKLGLTGFSVLSQLSGSLNMNLTESEIIYKDLLNKKMSMPLEGGAQFTFEKDKELKGNMIVKLKDFEVKGEGELKNEDLKFTFNTSQASLAALKEMMPSLDQYGLSRGEVSAEVDVDGKLSQPKINLVASLKRASGYWKGEKELFPKMFMSGAYNMNADFHIESFQNKVRLQKLSGFLSLTESKIKYSDYFDKAPGQNLYLQIETKPSEEGVAIEKGELKLLDIPFQVQGEIKDLKNPVFDLKTSSVVPDLSQLSSVMVMLKKFDARGKASLKGELKKTRESSKVEFEQEASFDNAGLKIAGIKSRLENVQGTVLFKNNSVTLKKISFKSGPSQFDVYGTLKNFDAPEGNLSVTASYLDLNEFFEKSKGRVTSSEEMEGETVKNEKARSVANVIEDNPFLKNMNMVGKIFVKNGKMSSYDYSDLNASISFQDRLFKLKDMDVKMYGGKIGARFNVNYKTEVPDYEFEGAVADLNLEQFLGVKNQQLSKEIQGSFSTHCVVRGKGLSWDQFRANALGSGKLIVKNGKFAELNIIASVMDTLKIFQSRVPDDVDLSGNFNSLTGNFEMEKGRVSTENLYLDAKDYYITLNGEFFMDKRIKYKGKYLFKKEGYGFPIFVDVSGTISKPEVHPDVQEYVKSILTGAITDIFN